MDEREPLGSLAAYGRSNWQQQVAELQQLVASDDESEVMIPVDGWLGGGAADPFDPSPLHVGFLEEKRPRSRPRPSSAPARASNRKGGRKRPSAPGERRSSAPLRQRNIVPLAGKRHMPALTTRRSSMGLFGDAESLWDEVERRKEEVMQLKRQLFEQEKTILDLKVELRQSDKEMRVRDKQVDDMFRMKSSMDSGNAKLVAMRVEHSFIRKLKKVNKELQNQLKQKELQLQEQTNKASHTRTAELEMEREMFWKEVCRLKKLVEMQSKEKEKMREQMEAATRCIGSQRSQNLSTQELSAFATPREQCDGC